MRLIPEHLSKGVCLPLKSKRNRPKPLRKPVTLIIGIICKDGIVVAADSQTTWGASKSWDASKMGELNHPYGRALVCETGAVISSSNIVEELSKLSKERSLFDQHRMCGLLEKANRSVRDRLRFQQFECSSEELQEFIREEELDSTLLIAHFDRCPQIHTIDLMIGITNRTKGRFEAIGSGADVAAFMLSDLVTDELTCKTASLIAVHVVEKVKRHDTFCGGPTRLGILYLPEDPPSITIPPPQQAEITYPFQEFRNYYRPPVILSASEVDEIVEMSAQLESDTHKKRKEFITTALKEQQKKRLGKLVKGMSEMMDEP